MIRRRKLVNDLDRVDEEIRAEIPAARESGLSPERIGAMVGTTRQTIIAWLKKLAREQEEARPTSS